MKEKVNAWLPVTLLLVFAATRWPGLMPQNFSAVYALFFCAGVYFRDGRGWWLPLAVTAATDLAINCYYYFAKDINAFQLYQLLNYAVYLLLIWLGRRFQPRQSWLALLSGGIFGAILFYLITNTAAWFFNPFANPEYTRDLTGWLTALSIGTRKASMQTWEFFRNTLLSGGLFTGLFVGAMKFSEHLESAREKEVPEPEESKDEETARPEESKA